MTDPLSLQQAIVLNVQLLQIIVENVQQARHFKPKCIELGNTASFLLAVLQKNSSALTTVESAMQLHNCLNNLLSFVLRCVREYNFLQKARELYVQKKLPEIQRDLDKWLRICLLEVVIKGRSDLLSMEASSWASFEKVKEGQADMSSKIDESMKLQVVNYQSLRKLVEDEKKGHKNEGGLNIVFQERDSRLHVSLNGDGTLSGTLDGFGAVICVGVNEDETRPGSHRYTEIYQHISDGTLVQSFHGLTVRQGKSGERKDRVYAVMEDMRGYPTLADMLIDQSLPGCLDCLRILYELANTIAYFHSLEMILKIINDESVVLRKIKDGNGIRFQPCLTDVVQARRFQEASRTIELDTRFDAPERKAQGVHTLRTDIWSLGIIILECVTRAFPYSSPPLQKTGAKTREEIRQLISQGTFPFQSLARSSDHGPHVKRLVAIANECCSRNPKLRPPSAAIVAESILDICNLKDFQAPLVIEEDLKRAKTSVLEAVTKRRDNKRRYEVSEYEILESDAAVLRQSAENSMDPVSHFLFGAAIWYGIILPSDERTDEIVIGPVAVPKIKLAQESLLYLESAFDSGNKDAAHECAEVHKFLGTRYRDVFNDRLKSGSAL